MPTPRVLLFERNPLLASVLVELFGDEGIAVTMCQSLADIELALLAHPSGVIVTDSWSDDLASQLSPTEAAALRQLGTRTGVVLTTGRTWARQAHEIDLGERVAVLSKPYELDDLLAALQRVGLAERSAR
ncbi:MAG: hypothetical protein M3336_10930 [Chloroflexota bacterium]|nr:hypothetical protein [Chloroflexota bacterium]